MDDERIERVARNEAVFRAINEQFRAAVPGSTRLQVVCECGSVACVEACEVTVADYESVRAHGDRFLVRPGHEIADAEVVVDRFGTFSVVRKLPGPGARVAEDTDPRARRAP